MKIHNWAIFDKYGHNLNWVPQPFVNLEFVTATPVPMPATGYIVTDVSGYAKECVITNEGYLYDGENVTLNYNYGLNINSSSGTYPIDEENYEITYKDVSIFNPLPKNTRAIESVQFITNNEVSIYSDALYNWYTVSDIRNITSGNGWVVPSQNDAQILYDYCGGTDENFFSKLVVSDFITLDGITQLFIDMGQPVPSDEELELIISPLNIGVDEFGFRFQSSGFRFWGGNPGFSQKGIQSGFWLTNTSFSGNYGKSAHFSNLGILQAGVDWDSTFGIGKPIRLVRPATESEQLFIDGTQCESYTGNDNKIYKTIKIGTQIWLAENLQETKFLNGDWIHGYEDGIYTPITNEEWVSLDTAAMCYYNDIVNVTASNNLSQFIYPSTTYAAALFLKPISVGLVETEHLFLLENDNNTYIRPYDNENPYLMFKFIGDDDEIKFFTINENTSEIIWSNEIIVDTSIYSENTPFQLNIGFKSEYEGVFERRLHVYHLVGETLYLLAEILVNAEAIGEDERHRTLLSNFGLPDPKDMKDIFKETNINEDLPNWEILNYKSKHMILEHDKIMPFIGTYKGLINAIKWLGYDDVYFREWFLNVKENKKISFIVPFEARDRTQTMLMFNADQRKSFKKLNQLSLNYCLTRETGEYDDWGTPITENCYSYNLKEVFVKLLGLKKWLEKNIIGVNARIVDITGEGIYYERIHNIIYETDTIGYEYRIEQSISPYSFEDKIELVEGDASIHLSYMELDKTKFSDMNFRFSDCIDAVWNPSNPSTFYSVDDPSYLADPSSYLLIGPTFKFPILHIDDIMWRATVEKTYSGVIGENLVTNPLFVLENDIRFYNILDTSSYFHCSSTNLTILLETAFLRDPSIDEWENSISYRIYKDPSLYHDYIMEDASGNISYFDGYVTFTRDISANVKYAIDDNYKVPLLYFNNFKTKDSYNNIHIFNKEYILDVIDGKIAMNSNSQLDLSENITTYLNWNYDSESNYSSVIGNTEIGEQKITVNLVYESQRMKAYELDPSVYYWADPSVHVGTDDPSVILVDNSIYTMNVNHTGDYTIELFAWDSYNTMLFGQGNDTVNVFIKHPTLYALNTDASYPYDSSISAVDISTLFELEKTPIYDRTIQLQGLTIQYDANNKPYVLIPSITYFQDVPDVNTINRVFNITERIVDINNDIITVDNDYQKFYTNDNIQIVKFNLEKYNVISEVSANVILSTGNNPTILQLDKTLVNDIDASTKYFALNNTLRTLTILDNSINLVNIDNYTFLENQNIAVIVRDICTNYEYGATYRIISSSTNEHVLDNPIPEFIQDTSRYELYAKHTFSAYSSMYSKVDSAIEIQGDDGNYFKIYLKDSNCQEYYIDNTFVYVNLLFDYDKAEEDWYKNNNIANNRPHYYHPKPIIVGENSVVVLSSNYRQNNQFYDNYLSNHKNIWEIINHDTSTLIVKVFNKYVPYVFSEQGSYDIKCTSYDKYGNSIITIYEGLIEVSEPIHRRPRIRYDYEDDFSAQLNTGETELTE